MKQKQKLPVWAFFFLIFLFPFVLLYLVYTYLHKLGTAPENFRSNSKAVRIMAGLLIFMGLYYMIAGVTGNLQTDDPQNALFGVIMMLLICCGGGITMLIYCKKCEKLAVLYEKYVPFILISQTKSIPEIASVVGVSNDVALESLKKLIGYGALKNTCIDYQSQTLVFPVQEETALQKVAVVCSRCGGSNLVSDAQSAVCEYCNMPLK